MERQINTYQGLNKDTAYDSIAASLYIDAVDIRITTTKGESMGAWTNIKGNKQMFTIPTDNSLVPAGNNFGTWTANNPEIIGYTTIRNRIILFVADDSGTQGWIYDVQYDTATRNILPGFPSLKYYSPQLNFKKEWPIEALGRYETDCVQRIYWTDYNNYFRTINIEDPLLTTLPTGQVDIFPDITYTQPLLKTISGGILQTGVYQVSYRLRTIDGKETLISPPGNMIHVVSDSETLTQSAQYNGDGSAINSGKALEIEVDTSTYGDFDLIEFIIIYHESAAAVPAVFSVETRNIGDEPFIRFIYTGNEGSIFPLELLTFTLKNHPFKTPKTLAQKDNSLVIANIKSSSISVQDLLGPSETFDARTARYKSNGTSLPFPLIGSPEEIEERKLKNAFNSSVDPSIYLRPEVGFNQDAHWDTNWHTSKQFKYKSDGVTLGGEGPNISYKFHLEPFTLDGDNPTVGFANVANIPDSSFSHDLGDGYGTYANTTFPNFASPFLSGLLRGYKRGEVYRFGIIFYTKKGETSFVEYIGDIKFPDISEEDSTNNNSNSKFWPTHLAGTGFPGSQANNTVGFSMGIEFTIDLSSCPSLLNSISGYQIVRVRREDQDKKRYAQGFVKGFWQANIGQEEQDFDLRGPNGTEQVLHLYPFYPRRTDFSAGPDNACFGTLQDNKLDSNPYVPITQDPGESPLNYIIRGAYLGFYSPEISFNYKDSRTLMTSLSTNPCLLVTGAYYGELDTILNIDFPEDLGSSTKDRRSIFRDCRPVTFNSKENVKKWDFLSLQVMSDDSTYTSKITTNLGGFFLRNYYAMDDYSEAYTVSPPTLNDPQGGILTGRSNRPQFTKAGTSIIGKIGKITNDFYTQSSISGSFYDWFRAPEFVRPKTLLGVPYDLVADEDVILSTFPMVDYLIPRLEIYGGFTKNSLENNIFIPASPVISSDNLVGNLHTFKVFGGDIFICMFTAQTQISALETVFFGDNKYRRNNSQTQLFPVETSLNLELAYGATLRTEVAYTFNSTTAEVLRQETDNASTVYGKTTLMYAYNPVYSEENSDLTFFVQPESIKDCQVNDIRAYLSNVKINDEKIDSWTKFGVNNFYDIDDYGPINKILNYKDIVYFFQDRGFGAYTINRAAITTTTDGVPTQLGTGQGFGKHLYHSKANGSIHQWGIKATDTGIYFFDGINRKIFMFAGSGYQSQNSPLSELGGIHSVLQNLPDSIFYRKLGPIPGDNPIMQKGVVLGRDPINDEVIFTFLGLGDTILDEPLPVDNLFNLSLVYDELTKTFSSRYSATPKMWIENSDILISPSPIITNDLYVHNIGNWGEFYGTPVEAKITLVINPNADLNKVLRTLEFNSIVRDDNKVIDRTQTITAFEISTEYQSTGKVPYSADRIMRKFDKWRIKIPRNQLSASKQDRLRSTHFILTLYFDNSYNKEIICNRLMSYYDVQIF